MIISGSDTFGQMSAWIDVIASYLADTMSYAVKTAVADMHCYTPSPNKAQYAHGGAGVYGFMVTLRDNPEEAIKTIQNGFPRK